MRLPIHINENSAEPLYHQIESQLRTLILSGRLQENELLPSNRELAHSLKCSLITIRRVYQDLEAEGLLRTRQGTGTYVAPVDRTLYRQKQLAGVREAVASAITAAIMAGCDREDIERFVREELNRQMGGEDALQPERSPDYDPAAQ
ncbi:GntR family transcriptional regulator [Paenibacillus sp. TAB 01]|uniref:GntR family transcriptional regulator n=1 Tax=Paenibacillus sp. TAB 01 TaxID=3368988 RepID=UPI003753E11A